MVETVKRDEEVRREPLMVDPKIKASDYLKIYEKLFSEAEKLYGKGDLLQAGEKYWGALCAVLNALGEMLGLDHYSHRDYQIIVSYVMRLTGDRSIRRLFASAETLHANYYHNFLDKESFDVHREDAIRLIEKLITFLKQLRKLK